MQGMSVMLFDVEDSKLALDGHLVEYFFEKYEAIKKQDRNVGWNLINSYPEVRRIFFTKNL
jgi:hypothetical protein